MYCTVRSTSRIQSTKYSSRVAVVKGRSFIFVISKAILYLHDPFTRGGLRGGTEGGNENGYLQSTCYLLNLKFIVCFHSLVALG